MWHANATQIAAVFEATILLPLVLPLTYKAEAESPARALPWCSLVSTTPPPKKTRYALRSPPVVQGRVKHAGQVQSIHRANETRLEERDRESARDIRSFALKRDETSRGAHAAHPAAWNHRHRRHHRRRGQQQQRSAGEKGLRALRDGRAGARGGGAVHLCRRKNIKKSSGPACLLQPNGWRGTDTSRAR